MALAMRLARGGRKKRPHYSIVVADKRMDRDGRFIEKLGTYNPLLSTESGDRVKFNEERVKYWLGQGAQPSRRIEIFLSDAGLVPKPAVRVNPKKSAPSEKTTMRIEEKKEKQKAAAEAAKAAEEEAKAAKAAEAAAPAEEAPAAEEAKADDAPAEEAKAEVAAEEKKTK